MDIVLLLAAIACVVMVNAADSAATKARRGAAGAAGVHQLTHYELAYLAGGPRRAINTALAVLARAGAVRVSRGAHITPVQGVAPSPVPLEQAVLDLLAVRPGGYVAAELRRALEAHPALAQMEGGLRARGLVMGDHHVQVRADKAFARLTAAVAVTVVFELVAFLLLVVGLAGKEFAYIGAVLFGGFGALTGFAAVAKQRRLQRSMITVEGIRALRAARGRHPRGAFDRSSLAMAVGVPVALYGLTELDDRNLCDELSTGDPRGDVSGSCGSHSDSTYCGGGSSSCGGGSSSCGSSSSSSCSSGGGSSCGSSSG